MRLALLPTVIAGAALLLACGGGDDGGDGSPDGTSPPTQAQTPEATPVPPEGFIIYRDGLGAIVALDLRAGQSYEYEVDLFSEVVIAVECTRSGDRIAFLRQSFEETDRQLVIDGAGERLTFALPPGAQGITWSPDASRIAYVEFIPQEGYVLSTLDLVTGEWTLQVRGIGVAGAPRWSPDGSRIAFHAPSALLSRIWVYDIDSGDERPTMVSGDEIEALDPEWASDGERLLISAIAEDQSFQIFQLDPSTGDMRALTDSEDIFKRLPRLSPGGDTIAYTGSIVVPQVSRDLSGLHSFGVFLMNEDGSQERPLTADPRDGAGAGVDPFLDAILIGWCPHGEWLNDAWRLREAEPTPVTE